MQVAFNLVLAHLLANPAKLNRIMVDHQLAKLYKRGLQYEEMPQPVGTILCPMGTVRKVYPARGALIAINSKGDEVTYILQLPDPVEATQKEPKWWEVFFNFVRRRKTAREKPNGRESEVPLLQADLSPEP